MRIKRKSLFMTAVLVFIMVVSIGHYSMYIGQQFYPFLCRKPRPT